MADGMDTIGARLTLDVNDFMAGELKARETIKKINADFREAVAGMDNWRNSIEGVEAKISQLNRLIEAHNRTLENQRARYEKLSKNASEHKNTLDKLDAGMQSQRTIIKNLTKDLSRYETIKQNLIDEENYQNSALGQLNRTIKQQEIELANLIIQYKNSVLNTSKYSDESRQLESRISQLNDELRENRAVLAQVNGTADQLTDLTNRMGKGFTVFKGILTNLIYDGIRLLGRAMKETIQTGIEWESAFMSVRRTVEGTEEQFYSLERALISLGQSTATPLTEIANLASLAGQMGLPVEDISEFTRVMIMLGDTTNISAEEAGDSLARLSNLLNLSTDDYMRMGSVLVDLGNKFPTTESEIAAMASRLGGTANMLGITADEVFGIANAISAVGLEAEMGGNAVSKTLREMQLAVENGTDRLAVFASTAGMTVDDFVDVFSKDASEALRLFINGLGNVETNGKSVTQILSELNITELRQVDTLSRLATNTDTFNESLDVAKEAWNDNTALIVEANKRYSTVESRIQMMKNAWSSVAITMEDSFEPAIRGAVNLLTGLARGLTNQRGASEELEGALSNLQTATALYKKAQDDAKESTDALTLAMKEQRKIEYEDSFVTFGKRLEESNKEIQGYREQIEGAAYSLQSFFESDFLSQFSDSNLDFLASVGFDVRDNSVDNILSMYGRREELEKLVADTGDAGAMMLLNRINQMVVENVVRPYNDILKGSESEIERLEKLQKDILNRFALGVRENNISYLDIIGRGLDKETEELFRTIDESYTLGMDSFESVFLTVADKSEAGLNTYLAALREYQGEYDILDDAYWRLQATIDSTIQYASDNNIKLKQTADEAAQAIQNLAGNEKSAQDIIDEFTRQRRESNTVAAMLGIPVEADTIRSQIEGFIRDGVSQINTWYDEMAEAEEEGNSERYQWIEEQIPILKDAMQRLANAYQIPYSGEGWDAKKNKPEEPEGDWFTRWFNSTQTDYLADFAEGLQSMIDQLADIWNQIGGGIIDVIKSNYDAQISAIDRESEHLKTKLQENLGLIEENRNIQENLLRKQLESGAIDEETYYRESAKNKYNAEAQKQKAEEETAKSEKKLQEQRQVLEEKQFNADKANSIADILISTAQAIAAAYALNPIYGAVMTAVLSGIGAAQVAAVASQQYTPALATGGIVTAPTTALIGEAGREAVLPLESNTEWMDELAYRIGSIMTTKRLNTSIDRTLNEDGKTVENNSNVQFTQIINSPKALSRKDIYRDTRRLVKMVDRRIGG